MKKYLITALSLAFITNEANAKNGFYLGADLLGVSAKHKIHGGSADFSRDYSSSLIATSYKVNDNNIGFGFNGGYKFDINNFYLAPEIFFEQLGTKVNHDRKDGSPYNQNTVKLNYRYGAKVNFGYNINKDFAAFVNYGTALVDYDVRWVKVGRFNEKQYGNQAISQIYGLGLIYNLNNNWSVKLAYDHQVANVRYIYKGISSRAKIDTAKVGAIYNF